MEIPFGVIDSQFDNPFESKQQQTTQPQSSPPPKQTTEQHPKQNTFGNKPFGNTPTNQPEARRYAMIDFYWILNDKLLNNTPLGNGESPICVLSYNATFGNMRIEFRNIKDDSYHGTAIVHTNCPRITSFNIYPEEAKKILYYLSTQNSEEIMIIERIINVQNWTPNESYIKWDFTNKNVSIKTIEKQNNTTHWITFTPFQTQMVIDCLKYMTDGRAWSDMLNQRQVGA